MHDEDHPGFLYARLNDPTVASMICRGCDMRTIIASLVKEKEALRKKIMELDAIAPFMVKFPDGEIRVWRCPDTMVPVREVSATMKGKD